MWDSAQTSPLRSPFVADALLRCGLSLASSRHRCRRLRMPSLLEARSKTSAVEARETHGLGQAQKDRKKWHLRGASGTNITQHGAQAFTLRRLPVEGWALAASLRQTRRAQRSTGSTVQTEPSLLGFDPREEPEDALKLQDHALATAWPSTAASGNAVALQVIPFKDATLPGKGREVPEAG